MRTHALETIRWAGNEDDEPNCARVDFVSNETKTRRLHRAIITMLRERYPLSGAKRLNVNSLYTN